MNPDQQFDDQNLARAEAILLAHEVARDYFQGELYDRQNNRLQGLTLERHDGDVLDQLEDSAKLSVRCFARASAMTTAKKTPISKSMEYTLEAALRRSRLAATNLPLEREVRPTNGKIRVVLNGKSISRDKLESIFFSSAINIPEFAQARKKTD
ncbi:hypothetical protein [Duganella sp. HH101]|uniref:hypothetical protein n=1 Tax=Duganella sp. HH101 TaxID=1781066 RepID=UPI00087413AD|nr:hypothetical protein [Duganella sp. HH101]